jgi:hypothetical protein
MADTKISALTAATTPLAGTEVLPIVQSGVTKQVSVADLTAGRAVSALSLSLTNALTAANGGTGQSSYTIGDILYASGATALSKLADVATGNALISGGVGVAPSWGKIGLTTHVSGVLPVANGGTNASSASITAFNNITGYSATGATGTTSTNLVFSTSPSITTPTFVGDSTMSTGNLIQGTASKGINFTANTASTGSTSQLLSYYEEVTAASTACTGAITTAVVWKAVRVGNVVTLTLPTTTGTAVVSPGLFFRYGVSLPTAFRPSASLGFPCAIKDNDTNLDVPGVILVSSTGTITVYKNLATSSNFTAGNTAGLGQSIGIALSWTI